MRVLLVQPPLAPDGPVAPPVGLAALAAWLVKLGHTPKLLDLDLFQRLIQVSNWNTCMREFDDVLNAFEPDVVSVTSMYSNSLYAARLITRAKTRFPEMITLAGGSHFGALPKESLIRYRELDFVIQGEGEGSIAEFLSQLATDRNWSVVSSLAWWSGEEIVLNPAGALISMSQLPNPWSTLKGILDLKSYLATIEKGSGHRVAYVEAGRGCPFACSFCATAPFWNHRYRVKPVDQIIGEIRCLHEAGYERFIFVHDLLTANLGFMRELCDALLKSHLPIEWMANARTDLSLTALLPRMKAAGCWKLFFGIESASTRIQASIHKRLDAGAAARVVAELGRHGLTSTCSFVIGFPDETPDEVSQTIRLAARMKVLGAEIVQFHRLRIWPPSLLSKTSVAQTFDPVSLSIEYPYLEIPAEDLAEIAQNRDFFGGYFTPYSLAGDHGEIGQLEMFAHHAVALAPMTLYAIETLQPGTLVSEFYSAIKRMGPLSRTDLDWDGGRMVQNWQTIKPYVAAITESMNVSPHALSLIEGILAYEDVRVVFATNKSSSAADIRRFYSTIDIPAVIRRIQSDESLDADVIRATKILLKRNTDGSFTSLAGYSL